MKIRNRTRDRVVAILPVFLLVLVLSLFLGALHGVQDGQAAEEKKQLERALRLGAVSCYATDGYYPPDLAYLEENCGIRYDRDRYTVFYEVFAENLMPEITVVEVGTP